MIFPRHQQPYDVVITEEGHLLEFELDAEFDVLPKKNNLSSLSSPSKRKEQNSLKKNVSFDTDAYMALIQHNQEYTPEEKKNCWYSRSEFMRMREENQFTIKLMKKNEQVPENSEQHCSRGLEHYSPLHSYERKFQRSQAWCSVLHEQNIQRQLHENVQNNEEILARIYILANRSCIRKAYEIGLCDAKWVVDNKNESLFQLRKRKYPRPSINLSSLAPSMRPTRIRGDEGIDYNNKRRSIEHISTMPMPSLAAIFTW